MKIAPEDSYCILLAWHGRPPWSVRAPSNKSGHILIGLQFDGKNKFHKSANLLSNGSMPARKCEPRQSNVHMFSVLVFWIDGGLWICATIAAKKKKSNTIYVQNRPMENGYEAKTKRSPIIASFFFSFLIGVTTFAVAPMASCRVRCRAVCVWHGQK